MERFADRAWRLDNLYTVETKEGVVVQFRMNSAQRRLLAEAHKRNVILKARQLGYTTFVCILMLDACLFNSGVRCGIIAHNKDDASSFFDQKVRRVYERLPEALRRARPTSKNEGGQIIIDHGQGRYSSIAVGTSHRSGTLQWLLVSEYGKICAKYPEKAKEVRTGAFPAAAEGVIFVESTAEGADGDFFHLTQRARADAELGKPLTPLDFRFHFAAWHENPDYTLDPAGVMITPALRGYFEDLALKHAIALTDGQKAWYAKTAETLQDDMMREHPSVPDEAFWTAIEGSYYSRELARAREDRRIGRSPWDATLPVYTWWDIGVDDYTACWFVQLLGAEIRLIDYREWEDVGLVQVINDLRAMPYRLDLMAMPHDIKQREQTSGLPRAKLLTDAGFALLEPPFAGAGSVADGIATVRALFSRLWIDEEKCAVGLKRLAGYRKEWSTTLGQWTGKPRHDENSHGADALRTGCCALEQLQPKRVKPLSEYHNPFAHSWMG